jgi:hypothetical protein
MKILDKMYADSYKKFQEKSIFKIISVDDANAGKSTVGLQKRSGRRVGNNVVRVYKDPCIVKVEVELEDGERVWISNNDFGIKFVSGEWDYKQYKTAQKKDTFYVFVLLVIMIVGLYSMYQYFE